MSTFDELSEGVRFESPALEVSEAHIDAIVAAGGYVHAIFNDAQAAARAGFSGRPLPGQGSLLLVGGLLEQTGRFDETTLALLGFDEVRFRQVVIAGEVVRASCEVVERQRRSTTGSVTMRWQLRNDRDDVCVDGLARMLFRLPA